jgi:hypothetical protein
MTMLLKIDPFWLIMAITTVGVLSYFVARIIDGVFGRDGFGTLGNMFVLTAGFFGSFIIAEQIRFAIHGLQMATFVGVAGALATFMVLAIAKLAIDRLL